MVNLAERTTGFSCFSCPLGILTCSEYCREKYCAQVKNSNQVVVLNSDTIFSFEFEGSSYLVAFLKL